MPTDKPISAMFYLLNAVREYLVTNCLKTRGMFYDLIGLNHTLKDTTSWKICCKASFVYATRLHI